MPKDAKGHGSNAKEMRALDAKPWSSLTSDQQAALRAHRLAASAERDKAAIARKKKTGEPSKMFPSKHEMKGMLPSTKRGAAASKRKK